MSAHSFSPLTAAMPVDQFCTTHSISRGTFYNLLREGRGPKVMKVGSRTLVSVEAAAAWRRAMETQNAHAA